LNSKLVRVPKGVYYSILVIVTEIILVSVAALILLPTGRLSGLPLEIIGYVLIYKIIIAIAVVNVAAYRNWQEHSILLRGIGLLLGRFVGLILGGLLGIIFGGAVGAILGAVVVTFAMGRAGSWISFKLGMRLDQMVSFSQREGTGAH
jgi:hypothetical protein